MIQYRLIAMIVIVVSAVCGVFMAGYMVAERNQLKLEQVATKAAEQASIIAAKAIAEIEIKNTTINNKVKEIITIETLYTECRHTDEAYQLILEKFKK